MHCVAFLNLPSSRQSKNNIKEEKVDFGLGSAFSGLHDYMT